eukprot:TRINITY_DN11736_c0_g1_i1.p1 TRINITY_DN11736_c0_g1~~TRINITY_DN11736_c0_g1_i1.p1  ORF type:complete len:526 (+),score=78.85 TRINITY_DN11736_c0_g1_i1:134-1711(+)
MLAFFARKALMLAVTIAATARNTGALGSSTTGAAAFDVDMVCVSHGADAANLMLLLRSVELYWPQEWGVVVVLDADTTDVSLAGMLPGFVRTYLEQPPPLLASFPVIRTRGYVRAQWTMFHLDRYTSAEYVAFVDSDVVLFTWVTPALLFRNGLPVVRGIDIAHFWVGVWYLNWPWVADFMLGFPFLLRRDLLPRARGLVQDAMASRVGRTLDFDTAFFLLQVGLQQAEQGILDVDIPRLACAQTLLGHAAYMLEHDRYAWAILSTYEAAPEIAKRTHVAMMVFKKVTDLKPSDRCPALTPAAHVGYWADGKNTAGDKAELGAGAAAAAYHRAASAFMLLGRCGDFALSNFDPRYFEGLYTPDVVLGADVSTADGKDPACASVRCAGCPGALYRLLSVGQEQRRIPWSLAPPAKGCPTALELVQNYSREWSAAALSLRHSEATSGNAFPWTRSSHWPLAVRGVLPAGDVCKDFCELLNGWSWYRAFGGVSMYKRHLDILAHAPDYRCQVGLIERNGVVVCPTWIM